MFRFQAVRIRVKVQAGAKLELVERISQNEFRIKVRPRAIDGQANERVRDVLAQYFQTSKSAIQMVKGAKSKIKIFEVKIESCA